eukprot:871274-Pleurochrysis_carterae.AAC.1
MALCSRKSRVGAPRKSALCSVASERSAPSSCAPKRSALSSFDFMRFACRKSANLRKKQQPSGAIRHCICTSKGAAPIVRKLVMLEVCGAPKGQPRRTGHLRFKQSEKSAAGPTSLRQGFGGGGGSDGGSGGVNGGGCEGAGGEHGVGGGEDGQGGGMDGGSGDGGGTGEGGWKGGGGGRDGGGMGGGGVGNGLGGGAHGGGGDG